MGDEVDVKLDGQENIPAVLLGKRRKIDVLARNIDTLVSTQSSFVLHLSHQHGTGILDHLHIQLAIVEEQVVAYLHVIGNIGIAEIDNIMRRLHLWTTENLHHITYIIMYRLLDSCGTNLRALGVYQNTDMGRYSSYIIDNGADSFF